MTEYYKRRTLETPTLKDCLPQKVAALGRRSGVFSHRLALFGPCPDVSWGGGHGF